MTENTSGKLIFLGTGGAAGVPVIGCSCGTCSSENPKNIRFRSSILLEFHGKKYLIDAAPDFREQALRARIFSLEALFLTHTHYDHIGGLEELRTLSFKAGHPIPCYLSEESFENVQKLFYYHFETRKEKQNYTAQFNFHPLHGMNGELKDPFPIRFFSYFQGSMKVTGFRFFNVAYVTDIKEFDQSIYQDLYDLDTLIISAPRITPTELQLTIDEAIKFKNVCKPKKTYLTHLSHEVEYEEVSKGLPKDVFLAYDGLELSVRTIYDA